MIKHNITPHIQPTNNSCAQAALATLLSYWGEALTPEDIIEKIPVNLRPNGEPWGSINQQLATWCIGRGYDVLMYSADYEILDLSWRDMASDKIIERLELAKGIRDIPTLGKDWSRVYAQSYIDFIVAGGNLQIIAYMNTNLIDELLLNSPVLVAVNSSVFRLEGRERPVGLHKFIGDDIDGMIGTHSIVIYGKNNADEYLVADPWPVDTVNTIKGDHLIAAMTAAQMECDNLLFQIKRKRRG